jgi:DHA1 family purine ribonucleoside efflux pump-like MFS transporter
VTGVAGLTAACLEVDSNGQDQFTYLPRSARQPPRECGRLQAAVFQVAIALGALLGGLLVDGAGVQSALVLGGIASALGAVLLVMVKPRPLT